MHHRCGTHKGRATRAAEAFQVHTSCSEKSQEFTCHGKADHDAIPPCTLQPSFRRYEGSRTIDPSLAVADAWRHVAGWGTQSQKRTPESWQAGEYRRCRSRSFGVLTSPVSPLLHRSVRTRLFPDTRLVATELKDPEGSEPFAFVPLLRFKNKF